MKFFKKVYCDGPTLTYSFGMTDVQDLVSQTHGHHHAQKPTLIHMNSQSVRASPRCLNQWLSATQAKVTHLSGADATTKVGQWYKRSRKLLSFSVQ